MSDKKRPYIGMINNLEAPEDLNERWFVVRAKNRHEAYKKVTILLGKVRFAMGYNKEFDFWVGVLKPDFQTNEWYIPEMYINTLKIYTLKELTPWQ